MTDISVEWVEEVPTVRHARTSPYDPIVEQVVESGQVAKIETTKKSMNSVAQNLRSRFKDEPVEISARTLEDGNYVFIARKGK